MQQRRVTVGSGLGTGLSTTVKYVRRTASGAASDGLNTTIKYMWSGYGLGTGLGTTFTYVRPKPRPTTPRRRRYIAANVTLPLYILSWLYLLCSSAHLLRALLLMRQRRVAAGNGLST